MKKAIAQRSEKLPAAGYSHTQSTLHTYNYWSITPLTKNTMRLSDFIVQNMEPILAKWETFAATLLPAAVNLNRLELRDHAQQILEAVATDLRSPQSRHEQSEKSMGRAPSPADPSNTAAYVHAVLRAKGGFNVNQLVAEYRALRACVLRMWMDSCGPEAPHLDDLIRFNEAIDQAVAESVAAFSGQVDQARNLLLGMLGHDMRSPLQTIHMTASYLSALNAGEKVSQAAERLIRSGARMQALLDDLCDFSRTRLGLGINIVRAQADLGQVLGESVDLLRAANPDRTIDFVRHGDLSGNWDIHRLQQLLDNLVVNALRYGAKGEPIQVEVTDVGARVHLEVRNTGAAIDPQTLDRIFEPLERGSGRAGDNDGTGGLGLGLYIASEVVRAHHGEIEARSDAMQTAFIARLPRQA
jgi:signal transduction histidine kinase